MPRRKLAIAALCVFVVSWFLPVHEVLEGRGGSAYGHGELVKFGAGTPPGWRAFRISLEMLADAENTKQAVLGATSLTNAMMIAAALVLLTGGRAVSFGALLLACAALNASWLYLTAGDPQIRSGLQIGYFLWVSSFVLMGIAMLGPARDVTDAT